eukprot:Amastigsp_a346974_6.p3 type:complete len:164 gc:universal Amastigsp_a346974_6:701-210(-)
MGVSGASAVGSSVGSATCSTKRGHFVFLSLYTGGLMATLAPRRRRMFAVRAGNRGCSLTASSGVKSEHATGPRGSCSGIVNSPTPMRGYAARVRMWTPGEHAASSARRRRRIESSTSAKSAMLAVYGLPGVDSTMKRPYSGWKTNSCAESAAFAPSWMVRPER